MKKWEIIFATVVLVVALVPRVMDLGVFLTADEKNWIGRSYEYIRAFKEWRFNEMLQTTHPGVTTLWLSGLAVTAKMLTSHIPFSFSNLEWFVRAAQWPIAVTNAVLVAVIYLLMRRLWLRKRLVAVLAALMIGMDPFIVGYSRVAHVDAMLGGLMMAAAISSLIWAKEGFSRRWLIISAVFTALAGLTKAPAIWLVPYFVLVTVVIGRSQWSRKTFWVERIRDGLAWIILVGIIFVMIWPAILWVPNPAGNVLVLKRDISIAAATPHNMNSEYKINSSFYWYTIITRATPVTLLLVIAGVLSLGIRAWYRKRARQLAPTQEKIAGRLGKNDGDALVMWLLLAYVIGFVIMMMLGAKKGDRYIMPIFFALEIMAAWGAWYLASGLEKLLGRAGGLKSWSVRNIYIILGVVIAAQMGGVIYHYHPYAIAYSNPLLPDNLSQELGWGEGLEQVGEWLNKNDPQAVVASWYPEELAVYTSAQIAHINAHEQNRIKYVVLYRNMFGREPDHYANDFIDEYYKKKEPVFTVKITDKEFAWVYEKRVYDKVLEELKEAKFVSQSVEAKPGLVGVDIMAATYSGQATEGYIEVDMTREDSGQKIGSWRLPVAEINDKGWTSFMMPAASKETGTMTVNIKTTATGSKAPTVRYHDGLGYRPEGMVVDGQVKPGNLAVRLRYKVGSEIVTEEDTRKMGR